jgi:hypothetical protein
MRPRRPGDRWRLVWGAIAGLFFAMLAAGLFTPSVGVFGWMMVGVAALIALLIWAQIARWHAEGVFDEQRFRLILILALCAEASATTALFTIGILLRSPGPLVFSAAGLFVFIALLDIAFALAVGDPDPEMEDDGKADQAQQSAAPVEPSVGAAGSSARTPEEQPSGSRRRIAGLVAGAWTLLTVVGQQLSRLIGPIAVMAVIGCFVAVALGHVTKPVPSPSKGSPAGGGLASSGKTGGGTRGRSVEGSIHDGKTITTPSSPTPHPLEPPWNGPCGRPSKPKVSPKAVTRMLKLFSAETHLEPSVEGCIGMMEPYEYQGNYYVTATGIEVPTKEVLSYVVYSEKYGGVLVLEAARAKLDAVVAEAGPVGGVGRYPRYYVEKGDYYLLRSAVGIYVLIREKETDGYEVLRPGLARAWYILMVDLNRWLWLSPPLPGPHGELIYKLWSPRNTERAETEVIFDPKTGIAYCGKTVFKPRRKFEPSLTELIELGKEA